MMRFSSFRSKVLRTLVATCFVATMIPVGGAGATASSASTTGPRPDSRYAKAAAKSPDGLRVPLRPATPSRVVVDWRPGIPQAQIEAAGAKVGFRVVRTSDTLGWSLVEPTKKGVSPEKLAEELRAARLTARVEVERVYQPSAVGLPNDPLFDDLWGMHNTGQTGGTPDADIDAPEAWATYGTGSKDVVVAVIDTGVDHAHADLRANRWVNSGEIPNNGRDDDGNGFVDDYYGYDFYNYDSSPYDPYDGDQHGTHVAGTIGAVGSNGRGVAGVNWNVTLMPVKFLGPYGGWDFDAAEAIVYAVDNGADIINASWGGEFSQVIEDAIQYAADHGVLFVAAAGNWGEDVDALPGINYPASSECTNVVTVAATDHNDELTYWSNYGANTVEVAAPGDEIVSTLPWDTCALYINSPPYRMTYLAIAAEAVEPAETRNAIIGRSVTQVGATTTTPILVVDDSMSAMLDEPSGERLGVYLDALAAAGFTNVSTWNTETQGTPAYNTLRNKAVVWFTGATAWGWFDEPTLNSAERKVVGQFLDGGGRMVMASGELGTDMDYFGADPEWFQNYFKAWTIDYAPWGYSLAGAVGTPFAGLSGSIAAEYHDWMSWPWPTGADVIMPIDPSAKPMLRIGGYGALSGTSMAAPHVAGSLALLKSNFPDADAEELKARIENTADYLPQADGALAYGGRINVEAAHRTYPGRPTLTAPKRGDVVYGGTDGVVSWTPAKGGDPTAEFEVEQGLPVETDAFDFESGDLSGFEMEWEVPWEITDDPALVHSGTYAARSGVLGNNNWGEGSLVATVTVSAAGAIEFWARHDTAQWFSVAALFVNERAAWYTFDPMSWSKVSAELRPGDNRLEWYFFNDQGSGAENVFAIDDVLVYEYDFTPIGTAPPGSTQIDWSIPAIDTDVARVRVRAVADSVPSAWATARGFRITTDTEAPGEPTDFTADAGTDGDAQLEWSDPADADFALTRIVRSSSGAPGGPNDPAGTVVYEGTDGSFYDNGLTHGETYHYAAFARDDNMNWSDGAHDSVVAFDVTPPEDPGWFSAQMWEGTVAVSWTPPVAKTYQGVKVLRRTDAPPTGPDDPAATLVYDGMGAWAADWELTEEPVETHAYYGAWAYDASGNVSDGVFDDLFVDTAPPEGDFYLNSGDEHTTDTSVRGDCIVTGATEMRFHLNGEYDEEEEWKAFASAAWFTLLPVDGWQSVTAEFRDASGNVSEMFAEIYVNLDPPPAPTGLSASVWGSKVKLIWDDPWGNDWDDDWDDDWDLPWWFSAAEWWDPFPDNDSFDVVGWNVYVAESEGGSYSQVNDWLVPYPQYMAGGLDAGTEYWFKVQAVDIVGHESVLSEAVSVIPGEGVVRHAGIDRYATAVEISAANWEKSDVVVLATGEGFADALGASSLAGCYQAPILLTRQSKLPGVVADEIARLGAQKVIIVGGTSAVSAGVESLLAKKYDVERIAGKNRYRTAANVATEVVKFLGDDYEGEVFIASGESFPDALTISPYAYSAKIPVLLVSATSPRAETISAIDGIEAWSGYVVGGTAVIPKSIVGALGIETMRISGKDRYRTSVEAADYAQMFGWAEPAYVGVAAGEDFADALAGGPATGKNGGVMVLTKRKTIPEPVFDALMWRSPNIGRIEVFGGPAAISQSVQMDLEMVLREGTYGAVPHTAR